MDADPVVEYPTAAIGALTGYQQQLDSEGSLVGVSRQALDEVLAYLGHRTPAPAGDVREALGHLGWLCDIAYNQGGAHELGYDPLEVVRKVLASPTPDSSAVSGSAEGGVLPIADAPRDGTPIIVPTGPGMFNVVTFWGGGWREPANGLLLRNQPTVFARIPAALTEGQQS